MSRSSDLSHAFGLPEALVAEATKALSAGPSSKFDKKDPKDKKGLSKAEKEARDTEKALHDAQAQVVKDLRRNLNTKDDTVTLHPISQF